MRRLNYLVLLSTFVLLMSCSKDSADEDNGTEPQNCSIEAVGTGCATTFLQGQETGWVRISKQGDISDPYFLYLSGENDDSYGTITFFLDDGDPVVKLNDVVVDDYLLNVSQSSDGSDFVCKSENNVQQPGDSDIPAEIKMSGNFSFPYYVQLQVNACF